MKINHSAILFALCIVSLIFVSGGSAQNADDTMGDLRLRAQTEDLDSYWLDTNLWAFEGYRSNLKVNSTRFVGGMPSYNSGANSYSWGMNPPVNPAPLNAGENLNDFQMAKNGTWH